ncbi:MAG TPA: endopeptidase La [Kofleriaceae bacterium]|nr:endopeptidase La [Kofleriaceae bacterium]
MIPPIDPKVPLPILVTRREIVLPGVVLPLEVGRRVSISGVDAAIAAGGRLLLVPQRDPEVEAPTPGDLMSFGVVGEVMQIARHSPNRYTIIVRSGPRVTLERVDQAPDGAHMIGAATPLVTIVPPEDEATSDLVERTRTYLTSILAEQADTSMEKVREGLDEVEDADDLVDMAAAHLELERDEMIAMLEEPDVVVRLRKVLGPLERLSEVVKLKANIRGELLQEMSKEQREAVLRQRMKSISAELGEGDDEGELEVYRERIRKSKMPDEARSAALKQVRKMHAVGAASPEHTIARTYLEWLLDVPWGVTTEDNLDLPAARAILEADHSGLEKMKKRILEFMAVRKLAPDKHGPILCLVGPPGVGKTSLGRSIAAALGRKYVRVSLGGVRDDADVRGHRRTYIGALPGRIVNGLAKAGTMNPVFVLDEIDKLSSSVRGDPASALLEVLDPEQNGEFVDHYLDVPVDLSQVMFIATANESETIPGPLLDRMEVLHIPGYTEREKFVIARRHLIPKQMAEHGIERDKLKVSDEAIREVIGHYTREAGVRNLERELATLCRHAAVELAAGGADPLASIGVEDLGTILGPPRFASEVADQVASVGVATGLGWMPTGGDLLFVETRRMPGKGELSLTGQVGDVMEESARAALSWVRANAEGLGIDSQRFAESDIHVHVPSGAIRKDGPSAGLAITTALTSLMVDRPVRPDVAITGEITLRGLVLPVGGIKGKVLAAHRAGIHTVLLPERNRMDMEEIPDEVRKELDIRFVSRIGDALAVALGPSPEPGDVVESPAPPVGPAPRLSNEPRTRTAAS